MLVLGALGIGCLGAVLGRIVVKFFFSRDLDPLEDAVTELRRQCGEK